MIHNLHSLYAQHLLNGKGHVTSSGGTILTFSPRVGSGWFSDKLKSAWSSAKNIFNTHVKPVVIKHGRDTLSEVGEYAKKNATEAARNLINSEGTIKDRLRNAGSQFREGITHDAKNVANRHKDLLKEHLLSQLR